jgi:hypothetical protein
MTLLKIAFWCFAAIHVAAHIGAIIYGMFSKDDDDCGW